MQHVLRIRVGAGQHYHPPHGGSDHGSGIAERVCDLLTDTVGQQPELRRLLQLRRQDDELVATEPRDGVPLSDRVTQPVGDFSQYRVTPGMAELRVHLLEAVKIDVEDPEGPAATTVGQHAVQFLLDGPAIGQAGERVDARTMRLPVQPRGRAGGEYHGDHHDHDCGDQSQPVVQVRVVVGHQAGQQIQQYRPGSQQAGPLRSRESGRQQDRNHEVDQGHDVLWEHRIDPGDENHKDGQSHCPRVAAHTSVCPRGRGGLALASGPLRSRSALSGPLRSFEG